MDGTRWTGAGKLDILRPMTPEASARLRMVGIGKRYPGVQALRDVHLAFHAGEVHALIGENGAGKSTCMKILAGHERPDAGFLEWEGQAIGLHSVAGAEACGVVMVPQEPTVVDDLTAGENVVLGQEPGRWGALNPRKVREEGQRWLDEVEAGFAADTPVRELSVAQRQSVSFARALRRGAKVLILDEPTAVLSNREKQALYQVVARLKSSGVTVLLVSHFLDEVLALSDRISVLRDGEWVGTFDPAGETPESLAHRMVGREVNQMFPARPGVHGEMRLELECVGVPGKVEAVSLGVRAGEIVGLAGLVGAGRTELLESLVGLRPRTGRVRLDGREISPRNPAGAMKAGLVYVSEDRKTTGLHLALPIDDNITLPHLPRLSGGWIRPEKLQAVAEGWRKKLGIKTDDVGRAAGTLSGGNQQKVALAKWMEADPHILLLDEPTRGVDVGAKAEIYARIAEWAATGRAVLVASSDLLELVGLCHRVVVMRQGRNVAELAGEDMTEQNMVAFASGVEE